MVSNNFIDLVLQACFPLEAKFFDRPRMTVMTVSRVVEDFSTV